MSEQKNTDMSQHFYRASAADFMKIPGSPVAYWVSEYFINTFKRPLLSKYFITRLGLSTANNDRFLRSWSEVNFNKIKTNCKNRKDAVSSNLKWFPYQKGGSFRKWYGNHDLIINWKNDGYEIRNFGKEEGRIRSHNYNLDYIFREGITWSDVTSSTNAFRYMPAGFLFDGRGSSGFFKNNTLNESIFSFLNSKVSSYTISVINPTIAINVGEIAKLPAPELDNIRTIEIEHNTKKLLEKHELDWDSYETSWNFTFLSLLTHDIKQPTISHNYKSLREQWLADTQETQRLEEENNSIFIDAYGLQDELTPEVPLKEITLTCNPHYRYGGDLTDQEREDRLQSDTIAELLSYAIGCMMGRYSLDREGLVYAHAGNEGFADLVAEGAYKTFASDDDGILPLTEQEWFSDDVTNRISEFVRTVWGEQHLEENLQFIADSLCLYVLKAKKGERALDTIRRYFSNQFYKDHLKTYKRRPIYWLFSSGKHKAFECLVYLHRYHEGTLARMRTEYVIPLSSRINARINRLQEEAEAASSTSERKQLMTELKALQNQQAELATFDEQLRHHADMRIPLDLDDGVKENYGKFGNLLDSVKAVTGQAAE